jgi:hypothetical protein
MKVARNSFAPLGELVSVYSKTTKVVIRSIVPNVPETKDEKTIPHQPCARKRRTATRLSTASGCPVIRSTRLVTACIGDRKDKLTCKAGISCEISSIRAKKKNAAENFNRDSIS